MVDTVEISTNVTRHVRVKVRHSASCPDAARDKGDYGDWQKCRCRKWLLYYDSSGTSRTLDGTLIPAQVTVRETARTREWKEAEARARDWHDQFDPDKVRIKQLETERRQKQVEEAQKTVTIEEAIGRFLNNKMYNEKRKLGTLVSLQTVLGYVDPKSYEVRRPGKLLAWAKEQSPSPVFVSDLTPILVESFLSSWKVMDTTTHHSFGKVKQFFKYCLKHRWISENPMVHSTRQTIKRGNRTGAFEPEQWIAIRDTARTAVENAPTSVKDSNGILAKSKEREEAERLLAFVELLRWSGMALIDATLFSFDDAPKCHVDSNGVLTYQRAKTDRTAEWKLPPHVIDLLRTVPVGRATLRHPFLEKGKQGRPVKIESMKHYWWLRLIELHKAAGIGKIKTEVGSYKNPGAHVYRDTFAVGVICSGINNSIQVAARALGDTIKMVEDHYSPWIRKMKLTQAKKADEAIAAQLAELEALENKKVADVVNIGRREAK